MDAARTCARCHAGRERHTQGWWRHAAGRRRYCRPVCAALQAGFDYDLDGEPGGWAFNADVKKIWINTDVKVNFTTALGATVNADVDIDPVVVGLGFGYKF